MAMAWQDVLEEFEQVPEEDLVIRPIEEMALGLGPTALLGLTDGTRDNEGTQIDQEYESGKDEAFLRLAWDVRRESQHTW